MNVTHGETFDYQGQDPLIDIIAEALGDVAGINIDDNCSISEMADLLNEIENHFHGDTAAALAAIRVGELQFEEVPRSDPKFGTWLEWHICPFSPGARS
jgi:hypothetical protein